MQNPSPPSLLGVLPSLPHMEVADCQHQAIRAFAITAHLILDPIEATMKE